MYQYKSEFLKHINERGYVYQVSDPENLDKVFLKEKVTAYIGFDCTAPNLHIGSLMQILLLKKMQDFGHDPIILIGGATSKIGDPSLKDKSRKMLTFEEIDNNVEGIKKVFEKFIDLKNVKIIDNSKWLEKLNYIDFLREIGGYFSVNRMLSFDSVKTRLEREQNLSFLEFNYMILQGYDFYKLNEEHNCILQMGGSDQWGNIICGIDLTRRLSGKETYGLTTPLLTTSSGQKMGKTEDGAIWLNFVSDSDSYSTHPRDFWNYWRDKTENEDVGKFLKLFTDLNLEEVIEIEELKDEEIEKGKELLATKVTELVHGKDADWTSKKSIFIKKKKFEEGYGLLSLLSNKEVNLAKSNSEARRFVKSNAIKLNNTLITDEKYLIKIDNFTKNGELEISLGKKRSVIIKLN
ncbi:MAG: tyrosine--tRNA ligase [Pseudomonadota bacterium]|nr:tyrosine--tRNA ligase [Pseudomonadota bacterium]MEC7830641.1 tyrosine--tRNA ligase [Pseudomonadota bacterium]MEC9382609.1 tyrosine--tRNA ligase [Pseudomonadota bacterium]MEC9481365.1 tyrosine--tRNA ligase [Pseudomonadota bacterium]